MGRKSKSKRGCNRWADAEESTGEEDVGDGDADDDGEDGDDDDDHDADDDDDDGDDDEDDEDGDGDEGDDSEDEDARCDGVNFLRGRYSVLEMGSFKEFTVDASDPSGPCILWGIYNGWCVAQTPC